MGRAFKTNFRKGPASYRTVVSVRLTLVCTHNSMGIFIPCFAHAAMREPTPRERRRFPVDTGRQQFHLVAENRHHVHLHVFLRRLENILAGLGQSAEQEDRLGTGDAHRISQRASEQHAGVFVRFDCQRVAVERRFGNHFGSQVGKRHMPEFAVLDAVGHQLEKSFV